LSHLLAPHLFEAQNRDYDAWVENTYLTQAWTAVFGPDVGSRPFHCVQTITEAIAPWRGREEPPTPLSVRLPLGYGGGAAGAFWVDIVRRAAGWRATVPTLFWAFDDSSGEVLVQLGEVPPSSMAELWQPDANSDHVCDLTRPTSVDSSRFMEQLSQPLAAVLS